MWLRRTTTALVAALVASGGCKSPPPATDSDGSGGTTMSTGGAPAGTGGSDSGTAGEDTTGGAVGSGGAVPDPVPKLYPVPGFESCIHAAVAADCSDGWCKLPPSCFVMGS